MIPDRLLRRLCARRIAEAERDAFFAGRAAGRSEFPDEGTVLAEFSEWLARRIERYDELYHRYKREDCLNLSDIVKTERAEAEVILAHLKKIIERHWDRPGDEQ